MDLTYFNPGLQDETSFRANFVARLATLEFLLRQLRLTTPGQPARHHLIVAPRGYGKTSLLRRIALAVRDEPELAQNFVPLRFREEQHNVISLDVFWRNCLESLLEAREDEHAPEAEIAALEAAWSTHAPRQALSREDQDGHPAWSALQSHCEQLGRRPLLLVDNLDTLLAGLSGQHQWALRRRLQSDDGPMLLAAASRYPDSTHDPAAAFYEFFRIQTLDRLDNREVLQCLRTIAQHRGKPGLPVLALLDKEPGRIAALNTMAGGNPRTLNVLYSVLESHLSADVLSQLSAMLDTFTGWYQARTEELPMQARAVFDALALNWNPMTAAALGLATGLDTPSVSSQLSRLEKSGYVETVALSSKGKGRSGYQVSERFFNIWYLMRNGSRRAQHKVRFLTAFLQSCFSSAERRHLARSALRNPKIDPDYAVALANHAGGDVLRQQLFEHARNVAALLGREDEYRALVQEMQTERHYKRTATIKVDAAVGVPEGRGITYGEAHLKGAKHLSRQVEIATVLSAEGHHFYNLGEFDQAIAAYDRVLSQFGNATDPILCEQVAGALIDRGISIGRLGHLERAIESFNDVLVRFGNSTDQALRSLVAKALLNMAFTLGQLDRQEQEVEVYDQLLCRFGDAPDSTIRAHVARALFNKGVTLGQLGQLEQELDAYDSLLHRFGAASELALREDVASALINKGITLGQLGRKEEELDAYDNVLSRFNDAAELGLREDVANALVNKGITLGELGKPEQEIAAYDNLLSRFGNATEPSIREQIARALFNKSATLRQLDRPRQAIEVYDNILARFGDDAEPNLRERAASALVSKGVTLDHLGLHDQALETYDYVVSRFSQTAESALNAHIARALLNKGITLDLIGPSEQAIETYDQLLTRFENASSPALLEEVAAALVNKGIALGQLGRPEEALDAYDQVLSRFGDAPGSTLRELVARTLFNKGNKLSQIGQRERAIDAYDCLLERIGSASEPNVRHHATIAQSNKGDLLRSLGRVDAARDAYQSAIALSPNAVGSRAALGNLTLDHIGDPEGAVTIFEEGLTVATENPATWLLHANCAYAMALHDGDEAKARWHVEMALADSESVSPAGRQLLEALSAWAGSSRTDWARLFEGIGKAIDSGDSELWTSYLDDLQRLIWAALSQGQGLALQRWMEEADYPLRQAPLYHAVRAAIDGEDHLLQINPETREPAARIYEGIARRLRIYAPKPRTKQPKRARNT